MSETAIFMMIDEGKSVKGSATAAIREDWIFIDEVNFGVHREVEGGGKDDHATWKSKARPEADPVEVKKRLDMASCDLFKSVFATEPFKQIEIDVCAPSKLEGGYDGSMRWYLSYILEECIVTSYEINVTGDSKEGPTETIVFDYVKLTTWFREWDGDNNPTEKTFNQEYDFVKAHEEEDSSSLDDLFAQTEDA